MCPVYGGACICDDTANVHPFCSVFCADGLDLRNPNVCSGKGTCTVGRPECSCENSRRNRGRFCNITVSALPPWLVPAGIGAVVVGIVVCLLLVVALVSSIFCVLCICKKSVGSEHPAEELGDVEAVAHHRASLIVSSQKFEIDFDDIELKHELFGFLFSSQNVGVVVLEVGELPCTRRTGMVSQWP